MTTQNILAFYDVVTEFDSMCLLQTGRLTLNINMGAYLNIAYFCIRLISCYCVSMPVSIPV